MFKDFLDQFSNIKLGGQGDDFNFPPVDNLNIYTYHYDAKQNFTGYDLSIIPLGGLEILLAEIMIITIFTIFLLRRKR